MEKALVFLDKYLLSARTFKILILIALFFMQIPFVHYALGGLVKYILLLGIVTCLWDFVYRKNYRKLSDVVLILLFAFALLYCITVIINRNSHFSENFRQLIYLSVFLWIFFASVINEDGTVVEKDVIVVSWTVLVITFVLSAIALVTFFFNINEWYYSFETSSYNYIGMESGRLCGLFNSNACGAIASVSAMLTIFLLLERNSEPVFINVSKRALLLINLLIQYLTLVLSKSRGSFYSFVLVVSLVVFVHVVKNTKMKFVLRTIIAVALSLGLAFGILKLSDVVLKNVSNLIVVSDEESLDIENDTYFENAIESILLKYYEKTSALSGSVVGALERNDTDLFSSSGRTEIWKAGFSVFKSNPIFGVTREGLPEDVNIVLGNESSAVLGGGLHNIYLTVLVSSGIVGFITIGVAVFIVLFKSLKVLFLKQNVDNYLLFSFAIVFSFLVSELVENRILYQVTAFNAVFWIYFGYLYFFAKEALKGDSNEFSSIKTE